MTTDTLTLTQFLERCIADDEGNARLYLDVFPDGDMAPLFRRVLAQCAAFRAVVALHEPGGGAWCTSACESESPTGCDTLRALASIYRDRDGWQEAWDV